MATRASSATTTRLSASTTPGTAASNTIQGWLQDLGWTDVRIAVARSCSCVIGRGDRDRRRCARRRARPGAACCAPSARTRTPPGRWARTPSPTSCSRWRSRRGSRSIAGWLPRPRPGDHPSRPTSSRSSPSSRYSVLILGGLANYWGVIVGSVILWTLLEGTRFIDSSATTPRPPRCASRSSGCPDPADGVPPAGDVRQEGGDGPR